MSINRIKYREVKTNNTASIGDRIFYDFKGIPASGVVRKVLVNSVITSLIIEDKYWPQKRKLMKKMAIPEETVVSFRRYNIEEWIIE